MVGATATAEAIGAIFAATTAICPAIIAPLVRAVGVVGAVATVTHSAACNEDKCQYYFISSIQQYDGLRYIKEVVHHDNDNLYFGYHPGITYNS